MCELAVALGWAGVARGTIGPMSDAADQQSTGYWVRRRRELLAEAATEDAAFEWPTTATG
ncbi:hypothetical protein acdb102_18860 [Acidothermaceae bacterium B102]|nr:hypothetical protein acdb102_18860 [Acidothermaceae bacterium B102]